MSNADVMTAGANGRDREITRGMTDSIGGALFMCFLTPFLWFFGVHGSTIVGGIMTGILQANSLENQALIDQGIELTVQNGGHIVTMQFLDQFINVTGAGLTIGLVIYMFFMAKSKQMKTLGRLEMVPALFNINEPVVYGAPVAFNPVLMVPFWIAGLANCLIVWFTFSMGLIAIPVEPFRVTMPSILYAPLATGNIIGGLLLHIVCFAVTAIIYYPFFKVYDKQCLEEDEKAAEKAAKTAPTAQDA